jgi:hypothetical protein
MSQLKLNPTWILELSTPDLRLILKALGGRLKPNEVTIARELGNRLTQDRVKGTQEEVDKLRENLEQEQKHVGIND